MKVKIALVQLKVEADAAQTFEKTATLVRSAAKQGAELILLQELCLWKYFCQYEDETYFDLAQPAGTGADMAKMSDLARELSCVIAFPYFEKRAGGIYHNSVAVFNKDGSTAGHYRKNHIPHDPCFYEKYYFTPGDQGYQAVETDAGCLGLLICWDQWFPEAARATALKGAQILYYPTAIGGLDGESDITDQRESWITIQRSHAIANGVFVASVNRTGTEDRIDFWGSSFVSDPFGRVVASAPSDSDHVLVYECDLGAIEQTRRTWPFLRDRRTDTYKVLEQRYAK